MNNTNFWGTDVDSIEKMATSLNDNDEMISSLFKRHTKDSIYPLYYKEPLVETDCKITDIASEIYEKLGVYDHCFVSACSKIVVGLSILEPNQEDLCDQFFMVATTDQEYMGFYMDGNFVFEAGLNGNDFREDKTSYRGYLEVISYIPENREDSVLYDQFSVIIPAIVTAPGTENE